MSELIFTPIPPRPHFGELTEKINRFWKEHNTFEKSVEQRPAENPYVFYDGPPFVTGLPHYGHLLTSIAKDLIPRFWTMQGKRVRRVWGWDCHGLPVENKVEQKLGLNSRRDIEKVGLEKFIEECLTYVKDVSSEWNWYIDHIGRWVDMEHSYRTMDRNYMESVWWVFKQIYDKNLIYQGKRVSLYCPRCGTPISNFEVAMDNSYKEITEPANVYKYRIRNEEVGSRKEILIPTSKFQIPEIYILAWSTTPWNKLATPALAVNPKLDYVLVKQGEEYYILAKTTLKILTDEPYEVISEFKGSKLEGLHFEPHYDFYDIPNDKEAWVIVGGDFVTAEEGTGVVTLAVYGEDDFKIMQEKNIVMLEHVDGEGNLTIEQEPWNGVYYLKANKMVNEDLTKRSLMYRQDPLTHSVALCWRCSTRLMYSPQDAWFIRVSQIKDHLLKTNEAIYWFPEHLKHGRFKKGIESAPDWCISRSRYWATAMPVWKCSSVIPELAESQHRESSEQKGIRSPISARFAADSRMTSGRCENIKVIGSIQELEQLTGKQVSDMHRPYIDEFTFPCDKCGGTMQRIPDVLDSWIDAGSMPYGERHYPFENKTDFEASFPADYIVEYVAQTRAWFYVLHVLSNALFDTHAFKNVICTGVIQGTDGRKMSKSYGNYPDPKRVLEAYGGDAFRLYMMSSPIMAAENLNINEEEIKEQNQRVLSLLWNCLGYFVTYANLHEFIPKETGDRSQEPELETSNKSQVTSDNKNTSLSFVTRHPSHILDLWIMARLKELTFDTEKYLNAYNVPKATRLIRPFIEDLSTWYIRRSRDRFMDGDTAAIQTLYDVLIHLSLVIAPTIPFIAEEIYQSLVVNVKIKNQKSKMKGSVHLCDWPQVEPLTEVEKALISDMVTIREMATLGNAARKVEGIGIKQPLAKAYIYSEQDQPQKELIDVLCEELNVKKIDWNTLEEFPSKVDLEIEITEELKQEGEARALIRQIQEARKQAGVERSAYVAVTLPTWPKAFEAEIKKRAMVKELQKGDKLEIFN